LTGAGGTGKALDHPDPADRTIPMTDHPHPESLDDLRALTGRELAVSDWVLVDQAMIDSFAAVSGDHQFIHTDPARAARTPLGGTIAHGLLLLSLVGGLGMAVLPRPASMAVSINYGLDRVRFLLPVPSGRRVRARFTLAGVEEREGGGWLVNWTATLDSEGEARPALVASCLVLLLPG